MDKLFSDWSDVIGIIGEQFINCEDNGKSLSIFRITSKYVRNSLLTDRIINLYVKLNQIVYIGLPFSTADIRTEGRTSIRNHISCQIDSPKGDLYGLDPDRTVPHTCLVLNETIVNYNNTNIIQQVPKKSLILDLECIETKMEDLKPLPLERQYACESHHQLFYLLDKAASFAKQENMYLERVYDPSDYIEFMNEEHNRQIEQLSNHILQQQSPHRMIYRQYNENSPESIKFIITHIDYNEKRIHVSGPVDKNGNSLKSEVLWKWSIPFTSFVKVNGYQFTKEHLFECAHKHEYSINSY